MNDQIFENDPMEELFEDDGSDRYEVSEVIIERAKNARNFALISMIVSCALLFLLVGTLSFSVMFPSSLVLAVITLPISIVGAIIEFILMIGAIILNIIALMNSIKQQKEFKLYVDGPEKDALEKAVKLGKIFTYIGVGVAALALVSIIPLNLMEFVLSIL